MVFDFTAVGHRRRNDAAEEVAENNAVSLDMDKLRKEIGEIKGVGESRLNEIMAVIEDNLVKG